MWAAGGGVAQRIGTLRGIGITSERETEIGTEGEAGVHEAETGIMMIGGEIVDVITIGSVLMIERGGGAEVHAGTGIMMIGGGIGDVIMIESVPTTETGTGGAGAGDALTGIDALACSTRAHARNVDM